MFALNGLYIHALFPFNLYRYHYGGGVFFTSGLAAFFGLRGVARSCSRRFPRALRRRRSRCRFGALRCCASCSSCASIREASARSLRPCGFGGGVVVKVHNTGGAARSVRFGVLRLRPCFGVLRLRRRRACFGLAASALSVSFSRFGVISCFKSVISRLKCITACQTGGLAAACFAALRRPVFSVSLYACIIGKNFSKGRQTGGEQPKTKVSKDSATKVLQNIRYIITKVLTI